MHLPSRQYTIFRLICSEMSSTNGIGCGGDFEGNHQEGKQVENEWHTNGEEGDAPSLRKKKQKFHIYTMEQIQILKS